MPRDSLSPALRAANLPAGSGSEYRPGGDFQERRTPELDLHLVGSVLRRRRWIILAGTAAVLTGVAALTARWPRTYKSSTTFLVEKQGGGHTDSPALDVLQRLGTVGQIQTEINLLRSRSVVEPVVADLDLPVTVIADGWEMRPSEVFAEFVTDRDAPGGEYRIVPGSRRSYWVKDFVGDSFIASLSRDSLTRFAGLGLRLPRQLNAADVVLRVEAFPRAVEHAQSRIAAGQVDRQADVIELSCTGATPEAAQLLCDGVSRSYIRLRTDLQRADALATAAFLRDQVARLGERLTVVEDSIAAYTTKHRVVAIDERASQETQQDVQVQAQRDQLEAEHDGLAYLLQQIGTAPGGKGRYRDLAGFPSLLRNNAVTGLLASLTDLENRRADLALRRSDQNADLMALDARIGAIEQQLRAMATTYEQALARQIRSLDVSRGQLRRRLSDIPGAQMQTARLHRERSGIEDVYRMLRTRLQEAEVAQAVRLPSVRIVDTASLPFRPSRPRVPLNLALGLIMGLGFGLALAVLREFRDPSLHESLDVERAAGLPVLALIPRLRRPGPVLTTTMGTSRPLRDRRSARVIQDAEQTLEALRGLAVDLKFAGPRSDHDGVVSVAVTSSAHGEGKTLTACNLALTRASHGVRTLLIDADMRAGGVADFLHSAPNRGLSDLLTGAAELRTVCTQFKVDGRETLSVIPAGTPTPHSAELLESPAMGSLLNAAKRVYDLIVIDTPPLNAVTDAATIAALVDGVVLVVRQGVTDREALDLTLKKLARVNGYPLGVVLNDARRSTVYGGRRGANR